MTSSRLMISLLLTATVAVDLAMLSTAGADGETVGGWPHPMAAVLFALCFSQVSLAAIWTALGRQTAPWRLAGGFLVVVFWSLALAMAPGEIESGNRNSTYWIALLLVQAVAILVPLSVCRATGLRVSGKPDSGEHNENDSGRRRFQFSIAYMLAWMTAVAVVLGMFQWAFHYKLLSRDPVVWLEIVVIGVCNASLAFAGLWAVLGGSRASVRVVVLGATVAAVTLLLVTFPSDAGYRYSLVTLSLVQAALLIGSLGVGRVAGFRLLRKKPLAA